jgi:hypothetical protein
LIVFAGGFIAKLQCHKMFLILTAKPEPIQYNCPLNRQVFTTDNAFWFIGRSVNLVNGRYLSIKFLALRFKVKSYSFE